ncbi:hypothetical protein KGQ96_20980 [Halomonas coralii]|uniref:hypothetical protein n=1 Tax=Modicisalibacter sp. R2A 31.J TaxID=2831898 RepID=UPI001CC94A03|nr:hypothetical protein [Modicisalibacter sp. R2A 31.J]MBZ9560522.1 hypothetical protein [Modicisalibacter sp. R2A 31.J]
MAAQQCPLDNTIESRLAIVCSFVCTCNVVPNVGKAGQSLKQSCVDQGLLAYNKTCDTGIRPQVAYFMKANPPRPLMLKGRDGEEINEPIRNFGHAYNRIRQYLTLPEYVKDEVEGYTRGDMRIPDAVVVRDPHKPPTQDNLLGVVEVKFPPDGWNGGQEDAYRKIAGDPDDLHELTPQTCACDGPRQQQYAEARQPAMATYEDRLAETDTDWWGVAGAAAGGLALVAAGAALTYFSGGLGAAVGQQAVRTGGGMTVRALGTAAVALW